jgi:Holliday junction resolvase RusA-like endonuclease
MSQSDEPRLELVIPAVAPPLNHAYGQQRGKNGRGGGRFKGDELKAFEALVAYCIHNDKVKWPFKPHEKLHATIVFCVPNVYTKKDGIYSTKFGDLDGRLKHTIDAVFRCFKEEANDLQIGSIFTQKEYGPTKQTVISLEKKETPFLFQMWNLFVDRIETLVDRIGAGNEDA